RSGVRDGRRHDVIAAAAATTSTSPVPLSSEVLYPPTVGYGAPAPDLYVGDLSAASISAGVAVGSAWNSWATMPAMCGAAIDVPLMVLNVPMSSGPGPFCGSRPGGEVGREVGG